jgi:TIR domain
VPLFDRLAVHFGADRVFRDIDVIKPGDNFAERIEIALASCSVLLALIGEGWLAAADESGRHRLDLPGDYVRLEIETALAVGTLVIPVLLDRARMPRAAELPPAISALAGRQALTLSPGRFTSDISYLLSALDNALASTPRVPQPGPSPRPGRRFRALVAAGVT